MSVSSSPTAEQRCVVGLSCGIVYVYYNNNNNHNHNIRLSVVGPMNFAQGRRRSW